MQKKTAIAIGFLIFLALFAGIILGRSMAVTRIEHQTSESLNQYIDEWDRNAQGLFEYDGFIVENKSFSSPLNIGVEDIGDFRALAIAYKQDHNLTVIYRYDDSSGLLRRIIYWFPYPTNPKFACVHRLW